MRSLVSRVVRYYCGGGALDCALPKKPHDRTSRPPLYERRGLHEYSLRSLCAPFLSRSGSTPHELDSSLLLLSDDSYVAPGS